MARDNFKFNYKIIFYYIEIIEILKFLHTKVYIISLGNALIELKNFARHLGIMIRRKNDFRINIYIKKLIILLQKWKL